MTPSRPLDGHTCYSCKQDKHKTLGDWHPFLEPTGGFLEVTVPGLSRWLCHRCWRKENELDT